MIRYWHWVIVLVLGLMVFGTQSAGQITFKQLTTDPSRDWYPLWRTDGSRILFSSNRSSNRTNGNDVWDMNSDGSDQRALVEVVISTPTSWGDSGLGTPKTFIGTTGDLVVYETQDFHELMRVALSQATSFPIVRTVWDGNDSYFTDLLTVPGGQNISTFALTANAQTLAWTPFVGGTTDQLRVAPFGPLKGQPSNSTGTLLLQGTEQSQGLAFSPDGTQLVVSFCLNTCTSGGNDLYIINAATGAAIKTLTSNGSAGTNNIEPTWSPTGQWIAFTSNSGGNNDIWIIRPDGSGLTQITTDQNSNFGAAWSPDGTMLAFTKQDSSTGNYDIWLASNVISTCARPVRPVPDDVRQAFDHHPQFAAPGTVHDGTDYYSSLGNPIPSIGPGGVVYKYTETNAASFGAIYPGKAHIQSQGPGPAIWVRYTLATGAPVYVLYGHTANCPAAPCWNDQSSGQCAAGISPCPSFIFNCSYIIDWHAGDSIGANTVVGYTAPYYLYGVLQPHLHFGVFVPNKAGSGTCKAVPGTAYCGPPNTDWGYTPDLTFPNGSFIDPDTHVLNGTTVPGFFDDPRYCLAP
jgi:hypothetical protein